MREKNCCLQEAIGCVSEQLIVAKDRFLKLIKEVPSFGCALDPQVRGYLDGFGNFARGVDCWEFECARYFGEKGRDIQKSRQVTLLPKAEIAYIDERHAIKTNVVVPLVEALEAEGIRWQDKKQY